MRFTRKCPGERAGVALNAMFLSQMKNRVDAIIQHGPLSPIEGLRSIWLLTTAIGSLLLAGGCDDRTEKVAENFRAGLPMRITNSLGMTLILVSPGEFRMGADDADPNPVCPDASPVHAVCLTRPFYLGAHEVTQAQYKKLMAANFNHPVAPFFSALGGGKQLVQGLDTSQLPVDHVTGTLAAEFCRRLSELPEEKSAGRGYRLPTEAEWEYACRGGSTTRYAFGQRLTLAQANFNTALSAEGQRPLGRVATVGSFPPNAFGFYDMHGSVWEWCADGMRAYSSSHQVDPVGPRRLYPVLRGGAWDMPAAYCRADYRTEALSGYVLAGFRVACDVNR